MTRIDTKREPSSSRIDARPQSLLNPQLLAIDDRLFDALQIIGISRRNLYDFRVALAAYENAFIKEQQNHFQCAEAYKSLHGQHKKSIKELSDMANKCLSLHQELESAQETIHTYERRLGGKAISGNNKDHDMSEADWDTVENATVIKEVLEGRIEELLNEKAEMMREYANEKSKMIQDHANEKSKMMQDHENEKSKMIQDHQNALINAANRISAAEGKIDEFEQMQLESVGPKSPPEPIRSPSVGKIPHGQSSEQQVMTLKRGKKRGRAAMRHNMVM